MSYPANDPDLGALIEADFLAMQDDEDDFTCACCGATAEAYGGVAHTHDDSTEDCTC
jgi:hypothetical protein